MARQKSPEELAEDIEDLKAGVAQINAKLDGLPYVRFDLYEARHKALRNEIAIELAQLKASDQLTARIANEARRLALWSIGLICTGVVAALFAFVARGG